MKADPAAIEPEAIPEGESVPSDRLARDPGLHSIASYPPSTGSRTLPRGSLESNSGIRLNSKKRALWTSQYDIPCWALAKRTRTESLPAPRRSQWVHSGFRQPKRRGCPWAWCLLGRSMTPSPILDVQIAHR